MIQKRARASTYLVLFILLGAMSQITFAQVPQTHFNDEQKGIELFFDSRVDFLPLSYVPGATAVSPDGSQLYVLNPAGTIDVYDVRIKQLVFTIQAPGAAALAIDSSTFYLYVAAGTSLLVFDTATNSQISSATLDASPSAIAIDSQSRNIFLLSEAAQKIWKLDEASLKVLNTYSQFSYPPVAIGVNPQNSHVYISDRHSITILDSRTLTYFDDLSLEGLPGLFTVTPQALFIELSNEASIAVFDTVHNELIDWFSTTGFQKGRWFINQSGGLRLVGSRNEILDAEVLKQNARDQMTGGEVPASVTAGSEFNISQSNGAKDFPSADYDSSGNFAVTFTDLAGNDGDGEGVYGREFSGAGNAQGGEFKINSKTPFNQGNSSLGSASSGDYVVAWRDDNGQDGDQFGVFFRRYSNGGSPKDSNDQKATNTTIGNQREASVDAEPNGDFVIVWTGPAGGSKAVFIRRFSANGSPKGNEQVVDQSSTEWAPDVATSASGRAVVAWRDGADDLVRVRVYNSSGSPVGGVFKVATTSNNQFAPSVAMDQSGKFIVAWQENAAGGIIYRLFQPDGTPITGTKKASTTGNKNYAPGLSMAPDGRFAIAWRDELLVAWARSFKADGTPVNTDFKPSQSGGNQLAATCAVDKDANFLVSWKFRPGGGGGAIKGRTFTPSGGGGGGGGNLTVDCTAKPKKGDPPLQVNFTADASGGTGSFSFKWDFGDGGTSTNQNPSHTYNSSGDFDAVVTVTSGPDTGTCSKTITVGGGGGGGGNVKIDSLTKTSGHRPTTDLSLSILGSGFKKGAKVSFHDSGIVVKKVRFKNKGKLRIKIDIKNSAKLGAHDVTVTNPGGKTDTAQGAFTVN